MSRVIGFDEGDGKLFVGEILGQLLLVALVVVFSLLMLVHGDVGFHDRQMSLLALGIESEKLESVLENLVVPSLFL